MLVFHAVGMGLAVGVNLALNLRILGVARSVPVAEIRRFMPVLWFGFWLNTASGVALLIGYPTKALTNPVFYLKLGLIAAALVILRRVSRQIFGEARPGGDPAQGRLKALAALSLVCWFGAVVAGRLLAYTYSRLTVDF
jgi:hypothetical protein